MDDVLILRKLAQLDTYGKQIDEYCGIGVEAYRGSWKTQRIVERTLQLMIELCTDIANHLISEKELPVPTSYANTFEILSQSELLTRELAERMVRMVRFRNILVHQYTDVDAEIVVTILENNLGDFRAFRNAVSTLLKS
jgi:uncharacterized protein YutE (UPF0331/DUF86 family)